MTDAEALAVARNEVAQPRVAADLPGGVLKINAATSLQLPQVLGKDQRNGKREIDDHRGKQNVKQQLHGATISCATS